MGEDVQQRPGSGGRRPPPTGRPAPVAPPPPPPSPTSRPAPVADTGLEDAQRGKGGIPIYKDPDPEPQRHRPPSPPRPVDVGDEEIIAGDIQRRPGEAKSQSGPVLTDVQTASAVERTAREVEAARIAEAARLEALRQAALAEKPIMGPIDVTKLPTRVPVRRVPPPQDAASSSKPLLTAAAIAAGYLLITSL